MGGSEDKKDDPLADFNIIYQQRVADREIRKELEAALNQYDWVLVVGKTGIGKSREIYHLAELLNYDEAITSYQKALKIQPQIDRQL